MTRCAVTAFWRALPPFCTLSAAISSATSSSAGLLSLIARTAAPRATRFGSSRITRPAFRSVFFHSVSSAANCGRTARGVGGSVTPLATPPVESSVTAAANSSRLSRSCLNASRLPCDACCAAFASRCDSMRIFPTAATYSVLNVASRASYTTIAASITMTTASSAARAGSLRLPKAWPRRARQPTEPPVMLGSAAGVRAMKGILKNSSRFPMDIP